MTFFLRGQKVLGVVDGSIICPDETHPQYYTWIQCDDIALSWITSTLSRPVLETFLNHDCNSSNEAWNILQQLFLDHASATQMQLRYRFQYFTKGDSMSMSDYMQQLHSIYRSLIDVGESLKDSDLVAQTLLGLPLSFSAFKTVMNASTPRPSFAALRPLLLSEEDNVVQSTKSSDSPDAMVLYSSTNNQQRSFNSSKSYNNRGRGRTGRFRGNSTASRLSSWNNSSHSKVDYHQSSYGPKSSSIPGRSDGILGASPAAAPPLKATTKCQICGDFNHAALDCSNRFNHACTSTHLHKSLVGMHFNDDSEDQKTKKLRLRCSNKGSLYPIDSSTISAFSSEVVSIPALNNLWHLRLGHPSSSVLSSLVKEPASTIFPTNFNFQSPSAYSNHLPKMVSSPPLYFSSSILHPITPSSSSSTQNHATTIQSKPSSISQAMSDEYTSLVQNNTWELVPLTNGHNLIGSKWVYKVKLNPDSSISRYKARLVAQGFKQQYGLDFDQTFSPVVKPATIRTVLTIKWDLRQLDVKKAFLNGTLSETIYMKQPQGFVHPDFPTHACLLQKSLYGLKQVPRAWFQKVSAFLLNHGFSRSSAYSSLFIFKNGTATIDFLLYIDDIVITGSCKQLLDKFIVALNARFQLNDLGRLNYFLDIEVQHESNGLFLSQKKYIRELLSKCLVGSLQYLSAIRPDITYAVNQASQSMHKPTTLDFSTTKRVLRYLAGTSHHGLSITSSSSLQLRGYSDSDWVVCPITRSSTSGYCVFIGPNLISWSSKKQPTVARSSTEAEYRALASVAPEITWLQMLLKDLDINFHPLLLLYVVTFQPPI
ncbi:transmembrane signal receptor [Lithospermum erythrorhizon]|uniref:Transmembrane signal receptor n=1 Tax=Lithospermum erythrorhizon TaxID=34254 RepID=A0AAV3QWH0_LITER